MKNIIPAIIACASIALLAAGIHIQNGCDEGMAGRLLYQFSHVSIWHLCANLAALYSISSSSFKTSWLIWLAAYIISSIFVCSSPTEGMSGMLYAVMGIISWQAANTRRFHLWCAFFIGVCFLFPNSVNGWLHVWCYISGVLAGLVDIILSITLFNRR